jgi:hypothetical protein
VRKILALTTLVGLLCVGLAGVAGADPNLVLTVGPHRHYVMKGDELVQVGPRYCDDAGLLSAFTQFHANTHSHNGVTGEIGPVAPGLHNLQGPEIVSGAC